jgi:hypothetical protein
VAVRTKDGLLGYIVRRLNAECYEISLTDKEETVILSPKEFDELKQENQ